MTVSPVSDTYRRVPADRGNLTRSGSGLDKREQVGVDHISVRGTHAVREGRDEHHLGDAALARAGRVVSGRQREVRESEST